MKDYFFKKLLHSADSYSILSTGRAIAKGYKPDLVLNNGNKYIIVECDTGTTRKGFVGGMIKAAKFLTNEKIGIAVFVIKEKENVTVKQIHAHLTPYFEWIKSITNLKAVYLIAASKYCPTDMPLKLLSTEFLLHSMEITNSDQT